jgi:hypothetical protein
MNRKSLLGIILLSMVVVISVPELGTLIILGSGLIGFLGFSMCRNSSCGKRKTRKPHFCVVWVLCCLFLTPAIAFADLIRQKSTTDRFEVTLGGELPTGDTSIYTDVYEIERTLTLNKFDPRLGHLDTGFLEFRVFLDRYQYTELKGCEWYEIVNYLDFRPRQYVYPNGPFVGDIPRFKGIDSSTGLVFDTIYSEFNSEFSSTDYALGFYSYDCPTYTHFWDYCYMTKEAPDAPDVDSLVHQELDTARFTGFGSIDYEFYTGFSFHSHGSHWGGTCEQGPWVIAEASLDGFARIRAQYVFSPAVDIFVSDNISSNVLRFRSDGQNVSREVFIPAGEGGLDGPRGLVFTPEGDLLVASTKTDAWTSEPPRILHYNSQTGEFLGVFAEDEQLTNPISMVYGPDGDLYVLVERSYGLWLRERVLRFNGQTGEFLGIFAQEQCGYSNPNCDLDVAWDLAFGPFGDLYVTSYLTGKVLRFDGSTGAYKDIFIDDVTAVRDIIRPENSASFYLLIGSSVREYKINPDTREAVYMRTVISSSNITMGTAIAMGPEMRLEYLSTVPSIFAAGNDGVFNYSPTGYNEKQLFVRSIGSASDVIVRTHVLQTISRDIQTGDIDVNFGDAGLGISVHFSEVTTGGTLSLAVAERAPGPGTTGFKFLNTYYEFSIHDGLSYTGDVEICIDMPPGTDAANAQIMRWDGSNWQSPLFSSINGNQVCATFPSLSWFGIALPVAPPGDIDLDGDVDRDDLNIILAARNTPADGPDDPRDLDGDGMITALDARKLVTMCTRPRCATE